ncbi:hypothetical protein [Nostoc sp.]|uniref:hypothetical protein n=1 Tax=Nostoc sp. TaxID=1180 RepID=UPI002FFC0051
MNFSKKFFNSNTRLIGLGFLVLTFTALPALAGDNCSKEDRVPLPGCVTAAYIEHGVILTNSCNHVVTVKVDIADGYDKRVNVGANGGQRTVPINGRYKLACCPRYHRCE